MVLKKNFLGKFASGHCHLLQRERLRNFNFHKSKVNLKTLCPSP